MIFCDSLRDSLEYLISVPLSTYREQQLSLDIQSTHKPTLGFQHNTELLFKAVQQIKGVTSSCLHTCLSLFKAHIGLIHDFYTIVPLFDSETREQQEIQGEKEGNENDVLSLKTCCTFQSTHQCV